MTVAGHAGAGRAAAAGDAGAARATIDTNAAAATRRARASARTLGDGRPRPAGGALNRAQGRSTAAVGTARGSMRCTAIASKVSATAAEHVDPQGARAG